MEAPVGKGAAGEATSTPNSGEGGKVGRGSREQGKGGGVESHKNLDALLWPLALHIFYISN